MRGGSSSEDAAVSPRDGAVVARGWSLHPCTPPLRDAHAADAAHTRPGDRRVSLRWTFAKREYDGHHAQTARRGGRVREHCTDAYGEPARCAWSDEGKPVAARRAILIHHCEDLQRPAVVRPLRHKVVRPDPGAGGTARELTACLMHRATRPRLAAVVAARSAPCARCPRGRGPSRFLDTGKANPTWQFRDRHIRCCSTCLAATNTRTGSSVSHSRPRLGCFWGTFSPSRRQSRSIRL